MSNFLAIATVSAALRRALQAAVDVDVPGALVGTDRPQDPTNSTGAGINVYLVRATPNAALRNADLPSRDAEGRLVERPRASLDLDFVLTFFGDESTLEPQRLLGSAVRTLEERPILTPEMIRDTIADPAFSFLAASDLAEAPEGVRLTPLSLSLEDLSKLWSIFFQVPYSLSLAYRATVVEIEGRDSPRTPLPVMSANLYVEPKESIP